MKKEVRQKAAHHEDSEQIDIGREGEMVLIPAGDFIMGSDKGLPAEAPCHRAHIDSFYMDKYEVTFYQYDKFCEATGREKPGDNGWGRGARPVMCITWKDAYEFAEWAGKRLPTEAEWEYTCRASSTTQYCFGDDPAQLDQYAWHKKNSGGMTHSVGQLKPNAWGL